MNFIVLIALAVISIIYQVETTLPMPRAPNFQYFERPKYRYPYYDQNGIGKILYGYGGPTLYHYTKYSTIDGIH